MSKRLGCILVPLLLGLMPIAAYGQLEPVPGTTFLLVDSAGTLLGEALIGDAVGVPFSTSEGIGVVYFRPPDDPSLAYGPETNDLYFPGADCTGDVYASPPFRPKVDVPLIVAANAEADVYAYRGESTTVVVQSVLFTYGACFTTSRPVSITLFPLVKVGELATEFAPPFYLKPVQRRGLGPPPGRRRSRRAVE
jgi:hypothetical protein